MQRVPPDDLEYKEQSDRLSEIEQRRQRQEPQELVASRNDNNNEVPSDLSFKEQGDTLDEIVAARRQRRGQRGSRRDAEEEGGVLHHYQHQQDGNTVVALPVIRQGQEEELSTTINSHVLLVDATPVRDPYPTTRRPGDGIYDPYPPPEDNNDNNVSWTRFWKKPVVLGLVLGATIIAGAIVTAAVINNSNGSRASDTAAPTDATTIATENDNSSSLVPTLAPMFKTDVPTLPSKNVPTTRPTLALSTSTTTPSPTPRPTLGPTPMIPTTMTPTTQLPSPLLLECILAWCQVGQDLDGEAAGDQFGVSVSLSADGQTLAAGGNGNDNNIFGPNSGHVRVFQWNQGTLQWQQMGQDLDGEAVGDLFGISVSLSADGQTLAAGGYGNNGNGSNSGHVRVFQWNQGTLQWQQMGQDLDGEAASDQFGRSVSLSADGQTLAAGSYWNDGNGSDSGHVRVFQWNQGTLQWQQMGQDLDGEAAGDRFGISVSLSADGQTLAAGGYFNDGNGVWSGHVRVFQWNQGTLQWQQMGQDLDGEAAGDEFGRSVSLSADGQTLAAGSWFNDGNGPISGHVRVFAHATE